MRPFRFELEAVRALREHAETTSRVELAGELAAGQSRDQELAQASEELAVALAVLPLADGAVVGAWDILATDAYLQRRANAHLKAVEAARQQAHRIELRRNVLVEASRKRQALERLKLRRHDAHRAEMERLELAHLNELALLLHERRSRKTA